MSNRGDLTGGVEIVEINGKMYLEIVFLCKGCNYPIVKDSYDHNNTICSRKNENWYCENCDVSDEEDDKEDDKEDE